jgi:hypothetical protein
MKADVASVLAVAIARNASLLYGERTRTSMLDSTLGHASRLVTSLVKQTPDVQARSPIAQAIAQTAQPMTFAFECLRAMRRTSDRAQEDQLLSEEGDQAMRSALVDRIRSQAASTPLHRTFGRDARGLYWLWAQQSSAEVASDLRQKLQADPAEVDALLDSYVGEARERSDGLPEDTAISRETYEAIAQLVDPEEVAAALVQRHGSGLGSGDFYRNDASSAAQRTAHQFLWMHRRAIEESESRAAAMSEGNAADSTSDPPQIRFL